MRARASKARRRPFGLTRATLRVLKRGGYIGAAGTADYTFNELMVLRTVSVLRAAKVPPRLIHRALRELAPKADPASPLNRIAWNTVSGELSVRDGRAVWEPGSGQYLLPLDRLDTKAPVVAIDHRERMLKNHQSTAHAHYLRACALEDDDVAAARTAYEACLAADNRHLDARVNLGRLLHIDGLLREAEEIYSTHEEPSAVLFFNLGVLQEDLHREADAVDSYRKALVHDPGMADAHFNLSLVHERLGERQAAFRHLLAYRRIIVARHSPEHAGPGED